VLQAQAWTIAAGAQDVLSVLRIGGGLLDGGFAVTELMGDNRTREVSGRAGAERPRERNLGKLSQGRWSRRPWSVFEQDFAHTRGVHRSAWNASEWGYRPLEEPP
jgi:hypothetical protein